MRFLAGFMLMVMIVAGMPNFSAAQEVEKSEIKKELQRLLTLREEINKLIAKKEQILKKIVEERKKLAQERKAFEEEIKAVQNERYKKLAKIFSKMDPELAGQKISAMDNMTEAAYIFLNMKERYAGQIMNYVSPEKVKEIVSIMIEIKNNKNSSSK
ncbi:MotE family protein [Desulfurobacterium atlanticum]|uniref:Flagellar motility protein MotE, a chaperone for MotC folding n=1 Tax=Desulfurobacterium atlanticum TaxID=240169 RepID=A0A238ZXX9_9BACT|nr:hypothetical protein [Desulfurobacterium atlanticum]SNR87861.1 hypothetical protein SAMN06265340_1136 [Desulfurobacterium atlanticum]